ncbi:phospholipase A2 inhibitor-like isoform X2 [Ornithodoros turicata]
MDYSGTVHLLLILARFSFTTSNNVDALCKECRCTGVPVTDVDCERKGLTRVPGGSTWPRNARTMNLASNFIVSLSVLEKSNITKLDVHHNKLKDIEPDVFEHFPHLEFLDLSNNALGTLHMNTFRSLSNLKVLNISHNEIRTLPSEIFYPLVSLEKLRLGHNPLRYMDKAWFTKVPKLHFLDMSSIDAHALPEGIFHLTDLTQLVMTGNEFDEIPSALRSAKRLKSLDVSDNPVSMLTIASFFKLKELEEIYITNMPQLESVEADTFVTQEKLRALHLHNNPNLEEVDVEAFGIFWRITEDTNWTLRQLHLQDNNMKFLSENTAPWDEIEVLDLQGNPWACECTNAWMRKLNLHQELTVRLRCASPAKYEETSLLDAPEELFECHHVEDLEYHRENIHAAVLALLIVTVLGMALVFVCVMRRRHGVFCGRQKHNGSVYYVKAHTNPLDAAADNF